MYFISFIFSLNFISFVFIILGIFSISTVQLLLVMVMIVFIQGMVLIGSGGGLIGSYLIIIYIGAIVILFAFCILFINTKENTKVFLRKNKILMYLSLSLIIWEIITSFLTYQVHAQLTNPFKISPEVNFLSDFSKVFYNDFILPLIIMIMVLMLGLILIMRIIEKK